MLAARIQICPSFPRLTLGVFTEALALHDLRAFVFSRAFSSPDPSLRRDIERSPSLTLSSCNGEAAYLLCPGKLSLTRGRAIFALLLLNK